MATCAVCGGASSRRALCETCSSQIAAPAAFTPEQVQSSVDEAVNAALIDPWGRVHRLGARTLIGREPGEAHLAILEGSISRRHAELVYDDGGPLCSVRDLGSTNGTSVGAQALGAEPLELVTGDRVRFGPLDFYYVSPIEGLRLPPDVAALSPPTVRGVEEEFSPRTQESEVTHHGLPRARLSLFEPTGGGGGYLELEGKQVQLSVIQLELVELLRRRMSEEPSQPLQVRGYVRSAELMAELSWDTPHPSENHVKQLVRRVRKALKAAGIEDLIESKHRLGYRLRLIPE